MKPISICLINAGIRTLYSPLVSPPMGLLFIAAFLREKFDLRITIINQKLENISEKRLAERIAAFNPDIVGISLMTPSAWLLPELTGEIRRNLPSVLIVAGGAHISGLGAAALEGTSIDLGVRGEGELSFMMIVDRFRSGGGYRDIPGLIIRDKGGRIVTNKGEAPIVEDLDSLPFPAYDLIDISEYWKVQSMLPVPRRRYISLFSSRGCPYNCIYCHNIFQKKYRRHSAERIVDEIEFYRKKYRVDEIEFLDDIFNCDKKRLGSFCDSILRRGIRVKIAFPNGVRADIFSKGEIDALKDAGLYMASFALETGSDRIQQLCGKMLNIDRFLDTVEYAVKKGVFTNGFAMFGFPGETADEMQATIDVAGRSRLHSISFFTVTPYPGSRLYSEIEREKPGGTKQIDYKEITSCHGLVNLSSEPDHILHFYQRKANREFYLNPLRLARLLRDHPQRHLLPLYIPEFLKRSTKGLLK